MSTGDVVWSHSADLARVESAERVVVVHLAHLERAARVLEGSGAAIWMTVDGVRTESEVVRAVAEKYAVAPGVISDDVTRLLQALEKDGLLTSGDRP